MVDIITLSVSKLEPEPSVKTEISSSLSIIHLHHRDDRDIVEKRFKGFTNLITFSFSTADLLFIASVITESATGWVVYRRD